MSRYRVVITVELDSEDEGDAASEAVRLARGIVEDHFETSNAAIDVWSTNLDQPVVGRRWCWWKYRPGEPDSSWGTAILGGKPALKEFA